MASEGSRRVGAYPGASKQRRVVLAALVAAAGLAAAKFGAVMHNGGSAMLSSTVHSLIDMSSLALLLHGLGNASEPVSGRQLYFWSFVVAILLYGMGAGVTLYEGVERLSRPVAAASSTRDFAVLAVGTVLAAAALWVVLQHMKVARAANMPLLGALRQPGNAALLAVAIQSVASLVGQIVALGGMAMADTGRVPQADAGASIAIGLVLAAVAALMALELKRVLGVPVGDAIRQGRRDPVVPLPLPALGASPLETKSMPELAWPKAEAAAPQSQERSPPKPQIKGKKGRGKHRR